MKSALKKSDFWILAKNVVTQNSERTILGKSAIRIVDGKIAEIKKTPSNSKNSKIKTIDASSYVLLPGFVQTHVHLCQTLFKNCADDLELLDWLSKKIWKMEAAHTSKSLYLSAQIGILELLSGGTTCILDMATVRHTDSIFKAVIDSGIRANVGKCLMDHPTLTPVDLRETTDQALKESLRLLKKFHGSMNDRVRVSMAPRFALSCTENLFHEISRISKELGVLIHTHASENKKEIEMVRELFGCDNIEYLNRAGVLGPLTVLAHCVWVNSKERTLLKSTQTSISHCPTSNLKLASGCADVPSFKKIGIPVSLGADGAPCNNNLNMFQEMRLAALIQKPLHGPTSMPAQEVLDMATREGAKALHWFQDIGSIEVGKKADIFAIDLNSFDNFSTISKQHINESILSSLVYSSNPSHIQWTMVDGNIVFSKGQNSKLLIKNALNEQKKILAKIKN